MLMAVQGPAPVSLKRVLGMTALRLGDVLSPHTDGFMV